MMKEPGTDRNKEEPGRDRNQDWEDRNSTGAAEISGVTGQDLKPDSIIIFMLNP